MLRKLAAAAVLAGLCLPYACDVRPVTDVWDSPGNAVLLGVPLVAAVMYAACALAPGVADAVRRDGPALHAVLRAVYLLLAGVYLFRAVRGGASSEDRLGVAAALLVTGAVVVWQQGRGVKADRVPLLLLSVLGLAVVFVLTWSRATLQIGGWLVTGGWTVAAIEEARLLRSMPPIAHGE